MNKQSQAQLLSVHALASVRSLEVSEATQSEIIYSSEQMKWKRIALHVYRHQPMAHIKISPIAENAIAMNLRGSIRLSGNVGQHFSNEPWTTGHLAIYPQGEPIELQCSAANEAIVLLPAPSFLATLSSEVSDEDPSRVEILTRINDRDPLFYQLGRALLGELQAKMPDSDTYTDILMRAFGLHLLRHHAVRPIAVREFRGGLSPAKLRCVLDYIRENLAAELTTERIAQEAQLSPYHFARLFKQSMAQSIHRYVLEQRLQLANRLLLAGQLSIGDVALRAGFYDQSHLSRQFKRRYGTTPSRAIGQRMNVQKSRMDIQDLAE